MDSEKPPENPTNDLTYPFANIYDDANMGPQNIYCAEAPLPDYGPPMNYPSVNSNMEDLLKINENYKKLNENFYKRSSQSTLSQNDNLLVNPKQPHLMNWSGYMNVNPDNTDFKPISNHNTYSLLNYSKYPTHRRIQNTYPLPFSSDLDENSNRMPPPNAFQYFNDNDEYLDIPPVNHFKSYNPIPNMKRFDGNRHYQYPVHLSSGPSLNINSSDKCEQNDIAEVTSTNEMDPNTMLVSSNCEGIPQHSTIPDNSILKPPSCDSHSPLSLTTNENYNCYPFTSDSVYPPNLKPKFSIKYDTQSQALNGHVLPSLFHNDCDNMEMNPRMSYFRHGNINQSQNISSNRNSPSILHRKSSHLQMEEISTSRYPSNSNYVNNSNSNFFNFYNESESTFTYPNVSLENEELLHKPDLITNSNLNNQPMYSEHFNPFFYGSKNDIYSKVTCSSNPQ